MDLQVVLLIFLHVMATGGHAKQLNPVLTVSPVVIEGPNGTCPSQENRTSAIESLSAAVRTLVQDIVAPSVSGAHPCGEGNWLKIAHLNMSDPLEECPPNWRLYTDPLRACGRPVTSTGSCPATFYDSQGYNYSKVCGRATGYQFASTDAFVQSRGIDRPYVDGLSITHGLPRTHIWTFAAGHQEDTTSCPCSHQSANQGAVVDPPSFVGTNYFCESGQAHTRPEHLVFYDDDPLWDGLDCPSSDCCLFNSPPWFKVQLSSPTSDNVEVRICGDEDTINEDTPISLLEIYIS